MLVCCSVVRDTIPVLFCALGCGDCGRAGVFDCSAVAVGVLGWVVGAFEGWADGVLGCCAAWLAADGFEVCLVCALGAGGLEVCALFALGVGDCVACALGVGGLGCALVGAFFGDSCGGCAAEVVVAV